MSLLTQIVLLYSLDHRSFHIALITLVTANFNFGLSLNVEWL